MKSPSMISLAALLATLALGPAHAERPSRAPIHVVGLNSLEPRVLFTSTTHHASSAALFGYRMAFVDADASENPPVLVWNFIDDPFPLSGTTQPHRSSVLLNDRIAAWHTNSVDGLQITLARLDEPGVEYVASERLNTDFEDMAIDGTCVSFAVFDGPPDYTISVYRSCLGPNGLTRSEIDGNLVRSDNGNPIYNANGVVAYGGAVAWSAGSFPPFVSSPVIWESARQRVTRLRPIDVFTVAMNRDSLLIGVPIGPFGGTSFLERYDRVRRTVTPIVSSAWYVQWVSMNGNSDIAYNTDHQTGDNQRTYLYRRDGKTRKVGPAGGIGSVLSDTVLAYALGDTARVYTLETGRDQLLSKGGIYNESLRVSGNVVGWIDFNGFANVSLPAREAIDLLAANIADADVDGGLAGRLLNLLATAKEDVPSAIVLANKMMGRFVTEVEKANHDGALDDAHTTAYTRAGEHIRSALVLNEGGLCRDRRDNDGDGRADCADPNCANEGDCMEAFACGDLRDNDGNGLVDCDDSACADQAECTETSRECYDGVDDDADGGTDCGDDDCQLEPPCNEYGECYDETDNDGDGLADCDDSDCNSDINCREFLCDDSVDNDRDGLTDCDDDECAFDFACQETECDDDIDNDADGLTDCDDDSSCIRSPLCHEQSCNNGEDDDHDQLKDCDDDDCIGQYACFEQGDIQCDDGIDNDDDGTTDCDEQECQLGLACASADATDLGTMLGEVARGDMSLESDDFFPVCGFGDLSLDAEFTWSAPATGTYVFDTFGSDFDTMLTVGDDLHLQCSDDEGVSQSRIQTTLTIGEKVLVIVHGYGPATGTFVLTIAAQ